jgi:hypothetical protein
MFLKNKKLVSMVLGSLSIVRGSLLSRSAAEEVGDDHRYEADDEHNKEADPN